MCHIWGTQAYETHDHSRNNPIVGVLALGEGWHNNHHAFPTSARHGLAWWQFDASWIVIRLMSMVGMARAVKIPSTQRMSRSLAGHVTTEPVTASSTVESKPGPTEPALESTSSN